MKALMLCLTLAWMLPAWAADTDIEKVNESIRVEAGQRVGKLSTVNGAIVVGADCTVSSAETVNGQISLGERTRAGDLQTVNGRVDFGRAAAAGSIETVNGAVLLADEAQVKGSVQTVNGAITLGRQARVDGSLASVSGRITLARAASSGAIETTSGDIDIGPEARARSIHVRKPGLSLFNWGRRTPRVVIGPGAVVEGSLVFDREVELYVSDTAKIGRVEGAEVQRFEGERPEGSDS